jgi:hypothetical protein
VDPGVCVAEHEDAKRHPELWRGKTHAWRLFHRDQHELDEVLQLLRIEEPPRYVARALAKDVCASFYDVYFSDRHSSQPFRSSYLHPRASYLGKSADKMRSQLRRPMIRSAIFKYSKQPAMIEVP